MTKYYNPIDRSTFDNHGYYICFTKPDFTYGE